MTHALAEAVRSIKNAVGKTSKFPILSMGEFGIRNLKKKVLRELPVLRTEFCHAACLRPILQGSARGFQFLCR